MGELKLFDTEITDTLLILTPKRDVGELDYREIEVEGASVLKLLAERQLRNLIVDLEKAEYYGSTALGVLVKLHKQVIEQSGRMFVAGVSDHEAEVMRVTKLDTLWTICRSRQEALDTIRGASK